VPLSLHNAWLASFAAGKGLLLQGARSRRSSLSCLSVTCRCIRRSACRLGGLTRRLRRAQRGLRRLIGLSRTLSGSLSRRKGLIGSGLRPLDVLYGGAAGEK
jgi:hypothetical protein